MSTSFLLNETASLTGSQGFSGTSKYAGSLQQVLSRSVGIASLQLRTLQVGLGRMEDRKSAVSSLEQTFSNLRSSADAVDAVIGNGLRATSVSDGSVLSAAASATAPTGSFSVEVVSLGAYSTAVSTAGPTAVADPDNGGITSASSVTLTLGSTSRTITPASASLSDLADAINAASAGVEATVVNVGNSGSPDYRLSLAATSLGSSAISLTAGAANLISTSSAGSLASYKVNGVAAAITSTTRDVTLAPGLSVTLLAQSAAGVSTRVTVRQNASPAAAALGSFARAYNAAVDAVAQHRGEGAGALKGDSLVGSLGRILGQLGTFSNGTPARSLAAFGVSLDKTGHLSVNTAKLTEASEDDFAGFLATLGSSEEGGFLAAADRLLAAVEDDVSGSLTLESKRVAEQITSRETRIENEQARISTLQENLIRKIARADAAIAALESRVSYVNGLFRSITGDNNKE